MPSSKMFIPDKIRVGYQNRTDTYTGKLAYVIYYDEKGKLRKEMSWEGWRDKKIEPQEFQNVPTEGFVLNKKAGGITGGWNPRNTYIRVWDPRNFEFEISVPNLLFILQECTATKGKGLEGEFVYAWDGTELVLLPVGAAEYKTSQKFTGLQGKKLTAKDVKPGFTYFLKNGESVLYLGRYPYNEPYASWTGMTFKPLGMRHIFKSMDDKKDDRYINETGFTKLAETISSNAIPEFPDELDKYLASKYHANIVEVVTKKISTPSNKDYYYEQYLIKDGEKFRLIRINKYGSYYCSRGIGDYYLYQSEPFTPEIKNGSLKFPAIGNDSLQITEQQLNGLEFQSLTVVTDKGTKIKVI